MSRQASVALAASLVAVLGFVTGTFIPPGHGQTRVMLSVVVDYVRL